MADDALEDDDSLRSWPLTLHLATASGPVTLAMSASRVPAPSGAAPRSYFALVLGHEASFVEHKGPLFEAAHHHEDTMEEPLASLPPKRSREQACRVSSARFKRPPLHVL